MLTYGTIHADKIHYDASGNATQADEAAFLGDIASRKPSDLFVISHGWNNDESEADTLYDNFFKAVDTVAGSVPQFDRTTSFALAIVWPSKKFDEVAFAAAVGPSAAQGTAAGVATSAVDAQIEQQLETLKEVANHPASDQLLDHAIAQIPVLSVSQSAQDDFVAAIASAFSFMPSEPDPGLDNGLVMATAVPGHTVLSQLAANLQLGPAAARGAKSGVGGAASIGSGAAAGFNPLAGIKNAALALANLTTYYTMKERAGVVGRTGAAQSVVKALAAVPNAKVHLIGHSFGGRLVTSIANTLPGGTAGHRASTMMLLQAAYSHYGMALDYQPNTNGLFRSVITGGKVASEIQITHSKHDLAVGLAYPLASALAHQIGQAAWINPYGGMGGDGAQATPEAFGDTLQQVGAAYNPVSAPNIVRNLNGDSIIMSHGDVTHPEIAFAMLRAASLA
jgi:hypothetical protein